MELADFCPSESLEPNDSDDGEYAVVLQTMSACSSSTKLFVVLPPAAANDYAIFGVNSVRPVHEVQDVVYLPASESATEAMVKVCFMTW